MINCHFCDQNRFCQFLTMPYLKCSTLSISVHSTQYKTLNKVGRFLPCNLKQFDKLQDIIMLFRFITTSGSGAFTRISLNLSKPKTTRTSVKMSKTAHCISRLKPPSLKSTMSSCPPTEPFSRSTNHP